MLIRVHKCSYFEGYSDIYLQRKRLNTDIRNVEIEYYVVTQCQEK